MVSTSSKKKTFIDETNLVYHGDVIQIHPYTQDEANQISTQSQECIYSDAKKKKKKEKEKGMFIKSQGWTTKNPFLLYIRLVHNLGRGNCTYKNLKESKMKPQHTGHFKKNKRKNKIHLGELVLGSS